MLLNIVFKGLARSASDEQSQHFVSDIAIREFFSRSRDQFLISQTVHVTLERQIINLGTVPAIIVSVRHARRVAEHLLHCDLLIALVLKNKFGQVCDHWRI